MDKEFKTTFIPKKKLASAREDNVVSRGSNGLLSLLAGLLFVTAIVSVVGVYLYKLRIANVVGTRIESINRAEKAFEPSVILELKKLDIRMNAGTELLKKHVAMSDFFDSLGESTLPNVNFADFSYTYDEDGGMVSMSGEARNYISIAQQSDIFEKNQYIKNHIFSDFSLTETNFIAFSLNFTLDPELIVYGRQIQNIQTDTNNIDNNIIQTETTTQTGGQNIDFSNLINANG